MLQIEKDRPVPSSKMGRPAETMTLAGQLRALLMEASLGDAVFVPEKTVGWASSATSYVRTKHRLKLRMRAEDGGVRVWLIGRGDEVIG